MGLTDTLILVGFGLVALVVLTKNPITNAIKEAAELPPQEVTSPEGFLGLRSTNTLGLIDSAPGLTPFQTALANLRDNLTFGGLLFQGNEPEKETVIVSAPVGTTTFSSLRTNRPRGFV